MAIFFPNPLPDSKAGILQRMGPESCDIHVSSCNHDFVSKTLIWCIPTYLSVGVNDFRDIRRDVGGCEGGRVVRICGCVTTISVYPHAAYFLVMGVTSALLQACNVRNNYMCLWYFMVASNK